MSKKLKRAFGQALREVRLKHSITQLDLSSNSGVHRVYVGELERGEKNPSLETIFRLADAINVSPTELIRKTLDHLSAK